MQKLKKTIKVIFSLITTAVLILILVYVFDIYKQNYFNEFGKAENVVAANDSIESGAHISIIDTVEKGVMDTDSVWNVACFVIPYTDVILDDGTEVAVEMTSSDIYNTKVNM